MNRAFRRLTALAAVILFGGAGGPSVGLGLLLESDTNGTSFLKLETNDFLLLEGVSPGGPSIGSSLLLEPGGALLLETGDFLLLEE